MMTENETLAAMEFVPLSPGELDAITGPRIEVLELLSLGGMGAVYKGRQSRLGREIAIKLLPPLPEREGWDFRQRFIQEARALAKLDHPGIIRVHDFAEAENGLLYFVMEYVDGLNLHSVIQGGRLTVDHIMSWVPQIAEALYYAHQQGLVHRDVKPANIMVTYEGQVKITDFGLVKVRTGPGKAGLTEVSMSVGTPDYLAPEAAISGAGADHRSDIYSLGVMLYEMLTGSLPRGAWMMPSEKVPGLDPRFDKIVIKAMQEDRENRHRNIREVGEEVLAISKHRRTRRCRILKTPETGAPKALKTAGGVYRNAQPIALRS